MNYASMLKSGIERNKISLMQVSFRLAKKDLCIDKAVLSKLQNGKLPPAKDEVNIALAEILGLDAIRFRLAAVRETIPEELIKLIKEAG
ncbi:hypothetical protein SAMN04487970_1005181 [Paenibacillus tianmuensis]|uniref:HTH cro/C1-type domain-containing protein n=1 Tax=Paenibacillus tianmuensis TaxID=624147 RepID=A0A1G4Q6F2_9BACL|nr:hypothetical protein [Paenibacillus tianmuensis]SCW40183.1 hypothetical protein SAMN04487970_1005181 [Paenibacillus tianmuensis]